MNRLLVILGGGAAIVVVAAVAFFLLVLGNLDSIVKQVIESEGSRVAGVPVGVSGVDIKPLDGRGGISGLTVGNPAGFKSANAVSLGGISVDIDTSSVTKPVVVIREIAVDRPEVTYELARGGNNIDVIKSNVEKATGGSGGSAPAAKSDGGEGAETKLIIENLYIRGGRVTVAATLLEGKDLSADLPDIHLKNIGKDTGGATADQIAEKVIAALTNAANRAASTLGVGKTLEALQQNLDKVLGGKLPTDVEGAKKAVDDAKSAVEDSKKAVEDAAKDLNKAGEGLKKLFGN